MSSNKFIIFVLTIIIACNLILETSYAASVEPSAASVDPATAAAAASVLPVAPVVSPAAPVAPISNDRIGKKLSSENKKKIQNKETKQNIISDELESRETNPTNFVRLLLMRLVYGIAVQMGVEERLSGVLNGAFVPPNADDDDYGGIGDLEDFGGDLDGGDVFDF